MDSSIENVKLIDEFEELDSDVLNTIASCRADAGLVKHLLLERQRKQQQRHSRRPYEGKKLSIKLLARKRP